MAVAGFAVNGGAVSHEGGNAGCQMLGVFFYVKRLLTGSNSRRRVSVLTYSRTVAGPWTGCDGKKKLHLRRGHGGLLLTKPHDYVS